MANPTIGQLASNRFESETLNTVTFNKMSEDGRLTLRDICADCFEEVGGRLVPFEKFRITKQVTFRGTEVVETYSLAFTSLFASTDMLEEP